MGDGKFKVTFWFTRSKQKPFFSLKLTQNGFK